MLKTPFKITSADYIFEITFLMSEDSYEKGKTHTVGKFQPEYLIFTCLRLKGSAICRFEEVKIHQTTCFLVLQIHEWELMKDVFIKAANICWGKSLVLNRRQKVKLIFFMHFFELQPGLAFI